MPTDLSLRCNCGNVQGWVTGITPRRGTHVICHCVDCQSFPRHLGRADVLDDRGGTEIFQIASWRLQIEQGAEYIACLRLSPKGLFRWYAACCNTPLANTLAENRFAFCGLSVAALPGSAEVLGPVICRNATASATGSGEGLRDFGIPCAGFRFIGRMLKSKLTGRGRISPFFDADGAPFSEPNVLTLEEREAARKG